MRKAERLFQIIQILRRSTRPVTASAIAEELEVSKRTVYRDVAHLIGQRVPIDGEAGLGYVLDAGYDMPPLMLTPDEIEAVMLGLKMVKKLGDAALDTAADDVLAKITSVVPETFLPYIAQPAVGIRADVDELAGSQDTRPLRAAIRDGHKLKIEYRSADGVNTTRIVWPVLLGYADRHSLLIAWCERRQAFRHFRTERMARVEVLDEVIGVSRGKLRAQWLTWREEERRKLALNSEHLQSPKKSQSDS
ncbi:helix-turn-helix transcriptional regulator [Martelella sp. FOR1707]